MQQQAPPPLGQHHASSGSSREISPSCSPGTMTTLNAPRYGTAVPNRIFVGGITTDTTETELQVLFQRFGRVSAVKIINDRAGVPRGYGFITFETDEEAKRVLQQGDNLVLKGRKLNVAIAVKKQQVGRAIESAHSMPNGTMMFHPHNGLAFPTYLNEVTHFYTSPEALYQYGTGPVPGTSTQSPGASSAATSPSSHHHPPPPPATYHHPALMYQQPFAYLAQAQPSPPHPAYHPSHFQAPQPGGGLPLPGAPWPQYLLPQLMVNSHLNHVS